MKSHALLMALTIKCSDFRNSQLLKKLVRSPCSWMDCEGFYQGLWSRERKLLVIRREASFIQPSAPEHDYNRSMRIIAEQVKVANSIRCDAQSHQLQVVCLPCWLGLENMPTKSLLRGKMRPLVCRGWWPVMLKFGILIVDGFRNLIPNTTLWPLLGGQLERLDPINQLVVSITNLK